MSKLLKESERDINNGNITLRDKLQKIAKVFLNSNIMSVQEAVYHLLSLPLVKCSIATVYVNTVPIAERVRILKSKKQLKKLDENSTDIYSENVFDKYEKRDKKLANVCLADFATIHNKYYKNSDEYENDLDDENEDNQPHSQNNVKINKKIMRYRNYKLEVDEYNYYREHVLLFFPFRNELNDVENADCRKIYLMNENMIMQKKIEYNKLKEEDLINALEYIKNNVYNIEEFPLDKKQEENCFNDEVYLKEQNNFQDDNGKSAKISIVNKIQNPTVFDKEIIMNLIKNLNDEQKQIVLHILNCIKTETMPFHVIIGGSAGVGKSTVIKAIYQLLSYVFDKSVGINNEKIKILLTSYTGIASFFIGGITLHTAFQLPIDRFGGKMKKLDANIANSLREMYSDLKVLVIDEFSMLGSRTFLRIDTRLRQITGKTQIFGGVSVILVGDLNQLSPVIDKPIYMPISSKNLEMFAGIIFF